MRFNSLKKRGRIILVSLAVFLPVAFILNFLWEYRDFEKQEHGPMLAHLVTYFEINKAVESGGQVPQTVDDFSTEFYKYHFQYYNPLAFGDPESIFFLCRRGRFYSITFGDGKQATLTYWFVPGHLRRQRNYKFPELGGRANLVKQLARVVVFGTIGILICAFVRRRSLESKVATREKGSAVSDANKLKAEQNNN